jgi:hypothetical protein
MPQELKGTRGLFDFGKKKNEDIENKESESKLNIDENLKQDVQQELKQDIQQELKQDIRQELKQDIRQELKQNVQQNIEQDTKQEFNFKIKNKRKSKTFYLKSETIELIQFLSKKYSKLNKMKISESDIVEELISVAMKSIDNDGK